MIKDRYVPLAGPPRYAWLARYKASACSRMYVQKIVCFDMLTPPSWRHLGAWLALLVVGSECATITGTTLQTINGIGASGAWWVNDLALFPAAVRQNMSDLLLSPNGAFSLGCLFSQPRSSPDSAWPEQLPVQSRWRRRWCHDV
jgi:hypothetical protein